MERPQREFKPQEKFEILKNLVRAKSAATTMAFAGRQNDSEDYGRRDDTERDPPPEKPTGILIAISMCRTGALLAAGGGRSKRRPRRRVVNGKRRRRHRCERKKRR